MSHRTGDETGTTYDRDFVLFGPLREAVLELWQVQRFGHDQFDDDEAICVYGRRPSAWHAQGIRLLGRTAVECTRDSLSEAMAVDVASVAATADPRPQVTVIDAFAGSANTLYWLQRLLPASHGVGFELDGSIHELTQRNLALIGSAIDVRHSDYAEGLAALAVPSDHLIVVFIGPPWGHALTPEHGLDLRQTQPAVADVVDVVTARFPSHRLLLAVQAFERMNDESVEALVAKFDWSELRTYNLNPPGRNPALLLGTLGWTPTAG